MEVTTSLATFGGGCFWCTEAIFQQVKGVLKVTSGYAGGKVPGRPTYREVCSGLTGHAEVVQITFNPLEISFKELLVIFMATHNPTTPNQQGADVGTQYRSVVFYHNEAQAQLAKSVVNELKAYFEAPIVTEISPFINFFEAEDHHQDYYLNNSTQGYCTMVIAPKLAKFRRQFTHQLKLE